MGKKNDPRTNQRELRRKLMETRQMGRGGRKLFRAAAARGQRPHTVDTSVPLPLLTARAP